MKLAALILAALFTLQLWCGEVCLTLAGLTHLSGDDYILQIDVITVENDPGSSPLIVKEVENRLPKNDSYAVSTLTEIKKGNVNWFIDSRKYLLKKGFKSTYSLRNDQFQLNFTGELNDLDGKEKMVSVKFRVSKIWPPVSDNDADKTVIHHERCIDDELTMKDGEAQRPSVITYQIPRYRSINKDTRPVPSEKNETK